MFAPGGTNAVRSEMEGSVRNSAASVRSGIALCPLQTSVSIRINPTSVLPILRVWCEWFDTMTKNPGAFVRFVAGITTVRTRTTAHPANNDNTSTTSILLHIEHRRCRFNSPPREAFESVCGHAYSYRSTWLSDIHAGGETVFVRGTREGRYRRLSASSERITADKQTPCDKLPQGIRESSAWSQSPAEAAAVGVTTPPGHMLGWSSGSSCLHHTFARCPAYLLL